VPTRLLALEYGADLVWGPEIVDKAIIGSTRVVDGMFLPSPKVFFISF
jgi:tRNA-dihydrouridine synthase 2